MNDWQPIASPNGKGVFQRVMADRLLVAVETSERVWTIFAGPKINSSQTNTRETKRTDERC